MNSEELQIRQELRKILNLRVGGFFRNTRRNHPDACNVCAGPDGDPLCNFCKRQSAAHGNSLADLVLTLTYARGYAQPKHQSAHTVRAYKSDPPAEKCADDMSLMVLAATYIHQRCIARTVGTKWNLVTFIPSKNKPDGSHPVAELARNVVMADNKSSRISLQPGPGIDGPPREVIEDKFVLHEKYHDKVNGSHVLAVDDTWTSGASMQSASIALKSAGAKTVTALCVARWCRYDYPSQKKFLDSHDTPYDPLCCPITGGDCPA